MSAPLTRDHRRRILAHLRKHRTRIVTEWTATQFDRGLMQRWQVAGVDGQPATAFADVFVGPLFDLFTGWLRDDDARWRAVYRDERLRYAPHHASPRERAEFFSEIIPRDEATLLSAVSADLRDALRAALRELHRPLTEPNHADVRLLAVGDCLMNEVRVFLPDAARERGFEADLRALYFSPIDGRDVSTQQVRDFLASQRMDAVAFSFLSYEGLPPYSALLREADQLTRQEIEQRVTAITGLMRRFLDALREYTDAPFLVHNASGLPLARARRLVPFLAPLSKGRREVLDLLNAAIAQIVENTPHTLLIDEMAVAQMQGYREAAKSAVHHARSAQFHTARFGQPLAATYADALASFHRTRKAKVIAVDFDNTLWQGVMADGEVLHHRDRQLLLHKAKEGGILLVAVSKNEPANVRWKEMHIQPDDFVLHKIGWGLKVESIAAAAEQLDVGLDTFIFIDDNDAECELVRTQLPTVQVLNSNDPFTWRSLERLLRFPNVKTTAEARNRTALYREQAIRKEALSASFDYPAMMANLQLALEFRTMTVRDIDRVTELVQRTNQFNTTTRRYSRQELLGFCQSDSHRVYVASLADKFGNLGLVLVAIVELRVDEAVIDSFVMSCRAMGFQLEQAVLRLIVETKAGHPWRGLFVASDRNTPCSSLYSDCGFAPSETGWLLADATKTPEIPPWFAVRSMV